MSNVKGCKRCSYKTIYNVDYERSAREQMIYYTTDKVCSKCNYNPESKRKYDIFDVEYCVIPLDKVTDDMNVDLSKIIHEHNHNKFDYIYYKPEYDKDICIKLTLIKHYKCDFCGKWIDDYTEIEEITEYEKIYNKIEYEIDYLKSAKQQKICYKEIKSCSETKNVSPIYENKVAKINNYPSDMNVDLSRIVHKHNCNIHYIKDKTEYDKNICIKLTLIKYYECDFCNKKMRKYTETKEFKEYKDIYDKTEYEIDYKKSARKQKIYYTEIKSCSKTEHVRPRYKNKIVELDNYPSDMNVNLTKIVHKHNHNKIDYTEDKPKFDNNGKCIEFISITHYKCDFCDKLSDYTETKSNCNFSHDEINLLVNQYKEYSECKKKGIKMDHPLTNIGICPRTGRIFRKTIGTICIPGNIRPFCIMPDRYVSGDVCSKCNYELESCY